MDSTHDWLPDFFPRKKDPGLGAASDDHPELVFDLLFYALDRISQGISGTQLKIYLIAVTGTGSVAFYYRTVLLYPSRSITAIHIRTAMISLKGHGPPTFSHMATFGKIKKKSSF